MLLASRSHTIFLHWGIEWQASWLNLSSQTGGRFWRQRNSCLHTGQRYRVKLFDFAETFGDKSNIRMTLVMKLKECLQKRGYHQDGY